jgi:hypothetical protein
MMALAKKPANPLEAGASGELQQSPLAVKSPEKDSGPDLSVLDPNRPLDTYA